MRGQPPAGIARQLARAVKNAHLADGPLIPQLTALQNDAQLAELALGKIELQDVRWLIALEYHGPQHVLHHFIRGALIADQRFARKVRPAPQTDAENPV